MNYIILTAITALLSFPQIAYEQTPTENIPVLEKKVIPEILGKIAICESRDKHFDANGKVLVGINKYDIGKYQINVLYWQELAEKLGHDIYTEKGNEAMAMELYDRYGTAPWRGSKKCWNK